MQCGVFTGEIVKWIELPGRPRFGFATTPDGKEIYVNEAAFSNRDQIPRIDVGTKIRFQLRAPKTDQQRFLDALNAGAYRDVSNVDHRNPWRLVTKERRPQAINVRIVENDRRAVIAGSLERN